MELSRETGFVLAVEIFSLQKMRIAVNVIVQSHLVQVLVALLEVCPRCLVIGNAPVAVIISLRKTHHAANVELRNLQTRQVHGCRLKSRMVTVGWTWAVVW